jgi:F0F1-type ATP synthase membrane subunit b/b'
MKHFPIVVLIAGLALFAPRAFAQEGGSEKGAGHASESSREGEHGNLEIWKWANFVVLAGALGYLIVKNAGPFFADRSRQIRRDLIEAEELRKHAEARIAEVEGRLAHLEKDIAALREESMKAAESETARHAQQAAAEVAKIQAMAEQEIASAGKAARVELKRYSAALAVDLAQEKIRARITPDTQEALVQGFVRDLDRATARAQTK